MECTPTNSRECLVWKHTPRKGQGGDREVPQHLLRHQATVVGSPPEKTRKPQGNHQHTLEEKEEKGGVEVEGVVGFHGGGRRLEDLWERPQPLLASPDLSSSKVGGWVGLKSWQQE